MKDEIRKLVDRFLVWQLPKSVRPDPCVLNQTSYPHPLTGTNLLTADEAAQMFEHVFEGNATDAHWMKLHGEMVSDAISMKEEISFWKDQYEIATKTMAQRNEYFKKRIGELKAEIERLKTGHLR